LSATTMNTVPLLRSIITIARGETLLAFLHCVDVYSDWQTQILNEQPLRSQVESAEQLFDAMAPAHPVFARCAEASASALLWHLLARAEYHSRIYPTTVSPILNAGAN
jgi:hypothetical protein